jgi:hypothetical protein
MQMMEGVAAMAVSLPSLSPTEAVREPVAGFADRRQVLAEVVAMKLRLGYELVSEDEFAAVVRTRSPRRWLWMRKGRANPCLSIAIDELGRVNLSKVTQTRTT